MTEPLRPGDPVTLRIARRDGASDPAPRHETYVVPYAPRMRILDALEHANEWLGADVAYRWFCGSRRCGQCAVRVNGEEKLACWEPAEPSMTIEPLQNFPLVRDLVIDRDPYEGRLRALAPYIDRGATPYPGFPEPLPEMQDVNALGECVECLICDSACPVVAAGDRTFPGPATLVQLGRFVLDVRDRSDVRRLPLTEAQVAGCAACRACEPLCPSRVPIVSGAVAAIGKRIQAAAGADHPGSSRTGRPLHSGNA